MTPKEKAIDIVGKMCGNNCTENNIKKMINPSLISVKNEYHSLRELLFNLKSCGINIPEKVYLKRIQDLINEEKLIIEELEKL